MKQSHIVQYPKIVEAGRVLSHMKSRIQLKRLDLIKVATAYISVAGLRALLSAVPEETISRSEWLVGLDDAISHPDAIERLRNLPNAKLRVASFASQAMTFHPKVYCFGDSEKDSIEVAMIGSANLTNSGLQHNGEAVVVLECESKSDASMLAAMWDALWKQGHAPSDDELKQYRVRHAAARKLRKRLDEVANERKPPQRRAEVLANDDAELDPSHATTCWIECGYVTLMGRELEFKAEQGLYFGLNPSGEPPRIFRFRTSNGQIVPLRMKYQENHMWRLQMNKDIPEVAVGLRPTLPDGRLGRSPYVAVFRRTTAPDLFDIQFLNLDDSAFARLRRESDRRGTIGQTSARSYGWC